MAGYPEVGGVGGGGGGCGCCGAKNDGCWGAKILMCAAMVAALT